MFLPQYDLFQSWFLLPLRRYRRALYHDYKLQRVVFHSYILFFGFTG